ncbi:multidrug effflux MFS transporter [Actinocatenispora rupis]|uniref:Bcr/CflA family drug resistance efflux transporter n=1 Tax=Actinocatenispora rupis TaxID=519421 RepID=A0A8J3J548_9ACTN|nr:multidrug effflux MFS transporter [Actinocatenispora rupis]GID09553.1 Bcr/CflA family drug resistance efflux transporter [Actinocatenispora rupis]
MRTATEPADTATVARIPVRYILILGGLSAFAPLSIDMYLPALPALTHELRTSASAAQLSLTACLVGLAAGQLLAGPVSDVLGRRRPLLVGLACYTVASVLCVFAPSVWALVALRLVQGLAGAAGIVVSRAVVRDLRSGTAAAKLFAALMLVNGVAPVLAPTLGAQLLRFTSWRGVFVVLTVIGAGLLVAVVVGLPETLAPERRHTGGLADTGRSFRTLVGDRGFVGYALTGGLVFAAMFAYISGSSFVLQDVYGLSAQTFGIVFGVNAVGIVAASQVSARLVDRVGPAALMRTGQVTALVGGLALLAAVLLGAGLPGVLPALFVVVASVGLVSPNAMALALARHGRIAGTASAVLGVLQYVVGAAIAPLVGVAGTRTAVPMAVVIAALVVGSVLLSAALLRNRPAA